MGLGPLVLITGAALLAPIVARVTNGHVPVVVAQVVFGLILGTSGLALLDPASPELRLFETLGFATLMFTVGMHLPLREARLRPALRPGLLAAALTVPLAFLAAWAIHLGLDGPIAVYTVLMVSSSAAIALPLVEERNLGGPAIFAAMVWIIAADVAALITVPIALSPGKIGPALLGTAVVVAVGTVVLLAAGRLRYTTWVHTLRKEGKRRDWAIDLRAAVFVLVALSFLAQEVGSNLLIAGFGTGLVVGALGGPKRLSREVLGLGQGFLIPVFFVLLGARIDLSQLVDHPDALALTAALLVGTFTVHLLASRAIRTPAAIGLMASAQVGVPAAIIALGLPDGNIDQQQASAILCAAVASILVCGLAARGLRAPASDAPPTA